MLRGIRLQFLQSGFAKLLTEASSSKILCDQVIRKSFFKEDLLMHYQGKYSCYGQDSS